MDNVKRIAQDFRNKGYTTKDIVRFKNNPFVIVGQTKNPTKKIPWDQQYEEAQNFKNPDDPELHTYLNQEILNRITGLLKTDYDQENNLSDDQNFRASNDRYGYGMTPGPAGGYFTMEGALPAPELTELEKLTRHLQAKNLRNYYTDALGLGGFRGFGSHLPEDEIKYKWE